MSVVVYLLTGLFMAVIQTSKLFMVLGMKYPLDICLIYLVFLALYSNLSPFWLLSLSLFVGVVIDALSGDILINSFIYPIGVFLFTVFRGKFLEFNLIIKLLLFMVVNLSYLVLNHLVVYVYSGLFSAVSQKDVYIFFNNLMAFYLTYLLKVYIYEKDS